MPVLVQQGIGTLSCGRMGGAGRFWVGLELYVRFPANTRDIPTARPKLLRSIHVIRTHFKLLRVGTVATGQQIG